VISAVLRSPIVLRRRIEVMMPQSRDDAGMGTNLARILGLGPRNRGQRCPKSTEPVDAGFWPTAEMPPGGRQARLLGHSGGYEGAINRIRQGSSGLRRATIVRVDEFSNVFGEEPILTWDEAHIWPVTRSSCQAQRWPRKPQRPTRDCVGSIGMVGSWTRFVLQRAVCPAVRPRGGS
jgi:hypothetical protein